MKGKEGIEISPDICVYVVVFDAVVGAVQDVRESLQDRVMFYQNRKLHRGSAAVKNRKGFVS